MNNTTTQHNKIIYTTQTNARFFLELKDGVVTENYIDNHDSVNNYTRISKDVSAKNFYIFKEFYDADNLDTNKKESEFICNKSTVAMDEDFALVSAKSILDVMFEADEQLLVKKKQQKSERSYKYKKKAFLKSLTKIQQKRFFLYFIKDLTTREIADLEQVSHRAVHKSIQIIESKLSKYSDYKK